MREFQEEVSKLLLGHVSFQDSKRSNSLLLSKVLFLLHEEEIPFQEIFEICRLRDYYSDVVRIIVAVTARNPHQAEKWLETLSAPFSPSDSCLPKETTYGFLTGVPLGIFQSAIWLNGHGWRTNFTEQLSDIIVKLIIWNGKAPCQTYDFETMSFPPGYENELSQTIKTYFRGSDLMPDSKGARFARAHQIIQQVLFHQESLGEKKNKFSGLGAMVLDQICYAIFGSISSYGRALAIRSLFQEALKTE